MWDNMWDTNSSVDAIYSSVDSCLTKLICSTAAGIPRVERAQGSGISIPLARKVRNNKVNWRQFRTELASRAIVIGRDRFLLCSPFRTRRPMTRQACRKWAMYCPVRTSLGLPAERCIGTDTRKFDVHASCGAAAVGQASKKQGAIQQPSNGMSENLVGYFASGLGWPPQAI